MERKITIKKAAIQWEVESPRWSLSQGTVEGTAALSFTRLLLYIGLIDRHRRCHLRAHAGQPRPPAPNSRFTRKPHFHWGVERHDWSCSTSRLSVFALFDTSAPRAVLFERIRVRASPPFLVLELLPSMSDRESYQLLLRAMQANTLMRCDDGRRHDDIDVDDYHVIDFDTDGNGVDSTLDVIRRNDPSVTAVSVRGYCRWSERWMGESFILQAIEALRENSHVTKICFQLGFGGKPDINLDPVLHMVQHRRELTFFRLQHLTHMGGKVNCDRYLQAATQNHSIHTLRLYASTLSAKSMLSLFTETTVWKLRKLHLTNCTIPTDSLEAASKSELESSLESAVQNNATLSELHVGLKDDRFMISIVDGLARSVQSKVETLELDLNNQAPVEVCRSIQDLLLSTAAAPSSKLRSLFLRRGNFTGETFRVLARGISNSANASAISFAGCSFDKESTLRLALAFQRRGTHNGILTSLCVDDMTFLSHDYDVIANVLGPLCQLERLRISLLCKSASEVTYFMKAVACSPKLETPCLDQVDARTGKAWSSLCKSLPGLVTLKSLHVTSDCDELLDCVSARLFLLAIQKNNSLIDVVGSRSKHIDLFDDDGQSMLARYAKRNQALKLFIDSNRSLPVQLWPGLAKTVQRCEGWLWSVSDSSRSAAV